MGNHSSQGRFASQEKNGEPPNNSNVETGFKGEKIWSKDVEEPSTCDYLVAGKYIFKTANKEVVDAKSLTFGVVNGAKGKYHVYYPVYFKGSGGVIFANGLCHIRASDVYIGGKATFSSPATDPFIFHGGYRDKFLAFTNDVHATESSGILVYSAIEDGDVEHGPQPFALEFRGNAEDFLGSVVVTSQYRSAENPVTAKFTLAGSATYFGGSVAVDRGAVFKAGVDTSVGSLTLESGAILDLSSVASFEVRNNLTIDEGSVIKLKNGIKLKVGSLTLKNGADFDLSSVSCLEVQDFSIAEGSELNMRLGNALTVGDAFSLPKSPIAIKLSGTPKSAVSEVTRYALVTMPANCDYPIDNFIIEDDSTSFYTKTKLEFILSEDGKTKTLFASYFPIVRNRLDNNVSHDDPYSESAEEHGEYWDDKSPVHSRAHYFVDKLNSRSTYFTTRYAPQEALSFEGESLSFDGYTYMRLRIGDFSVPYMKCAGSGVIGLSGGNHILRSRFDITGYLLVEPRKNGFIKLVGPITGKESSTLTFRGESASTSNCRGTVELDGDNTGYPGKIKVTLAYPEKLVLGSQFTSLIARRADNLGGARTVFAYDALQIDNGSRLDALESFELSEPTRGVFVSWIGRILVAEEKELAIKQQLTVNGRVHKEGAGTLALGGDLRFLDIYTNRIETVIDVAEVITNDVGEIVTNLVPTVTNRLQEVINVVDTIPEDAANRTFYVTGGRVKPLSAHALDGLDVVFSNKTSKLDVGLVLDINSEDEELRAKGICNVKSPAPLAFLDDDAQKKVPLYLEWDNIPQADEYSFNVMTVKADCADVFNKLKIVVPQSLAHLKLTTTRNVDAEAGTVTLSAKLKKYGFTISIR